MITLLSDIHTPVYMASSDPKDLHSTEDPENVQCRKQELEILRDLLNLEKTLSSKLMKTLIRERINFQLAVEKISLLKDVIARE